MKRLAAIKNVGVVFGLLVVFFTVGLSPTQAAHIEEFFELVQDADQVVWLNDQNETLVLDQGDVGDPVRISHGEKIGGLFGEYRSLDGLQRFLGGEFGGSAQGNGCVNARRFQQGATHQFATKREHLIQWRIAEIHIDEAIGRRLAEQGMT